MPWCGPQVEVLVQVVSALFDINPSMNTHMAMPLWKRCVGTLLEVRGIGVHGAQCLPACSTCCSAIVLLLPVQHALPCICAHVTMSRQNRACQSDGCSNIHGLCQFLGYHWSAFGMWPKVRIL